MRTDRQRTRDLIRIYYDAYVRQTSAAGIEFFVGFLHGMVRAIYEVNTITYNEWNRYASFFDKVYYKKKEELRRDTAGH